MSKRQTLILLGIWVMVLLYLGFRESADKILLLISGALIVFIAWRLKPEAPDNFRQSDHKNDKPYVDNLNRE